MANRNFMNGGKLFKMRAAPVSIDMNMIVDSTQGEGQSNLDAPLVSSVQMFSSSPASDNIPPIAGMILIRLQDVYNALLGMNWSVLQEPLSGSDLKVDNDGSAPLTVGQSYTISILGNITTADWRTLGVPADITPAVGVSFIAAAIGIGTGNTKTSRVQVQVSSAVASIEIVALQQPDPGSQEGSQIILACRDYAGALVAPVDGTTLAVELLMNNSSVKQGQ